MKEQSQQDKGTFGTYLELLKQKRAAETDEDRLFQVLDQLSESEAKPIPQVLKTLDVPVDQFADSLQILEDLDMVSVSEQEGAKVLTLTKGGAEFMSARKSENV